MKLLFLPNIPEEEDIDTCNKLNELLKNDVNIVFYLPPSDFLWELFLRKNFIPNIIKDEKLDSNRILAVAPGYLIQEPARFHNCTEGLPIYPDARCPHLSSKFAAPGNYVYDFIPTVINYYREKQVKIEDVAIIIEDREVRNEESSDYYSDFHLKYYSGQRNEELESYVKGNNIKYLKINQKWSQCLSEVNQLYDSRESNIPLINLDILYQPYFSETKLSNKFSVLFTDRDGTLLVGNKEETMQNFELLKSFLQAGNLVFIITSSNHEKDIFDESAFAKFCWEELREYQNQIIGLPGLCSAVTLGGIHLPIGHAAIRKTEIIEKIIHLFQERGYEFDKMFCVGDGLLDIEMIVENIAKFGIIGYHIRKNEEFLENIIKMNGENYVPNQNWDYQSYIKSHKVDSFSTFMKQYVLSEAKDEEPRQKTIRYEN